MPIGNIDQWIHQAIINTVQDTIVSVINDKTVYKISGIYNFRYLHVALVSLVYGLAISFLQFLKDNTWPNTNSKHPSCHT